MSSDELLDQAADIIAKARADCLRLEEQNGNQR